LFDSNNPTGGDGDLGAPFTHVTTGQVKNPGNILIIHEQYSGCRNSGGSSVVGYTNTNGYTQNAVSCDNPDDNASGGRFEINFNKDITLSSIDFFDIEGAETTNDNEIKLFDANGNQIMDNAFYTPFTRLIPAVITNGPQLILAILVVSGGSRLGVRAPAPLAISRA